MAEHERREKLSPTRKGIGRNQWSLRGGNNPTRTAFQREDRQQKGEKLGQNLSSWFLRVNVHWEKNAKFNVYVNQHWCFANTNGIVILVNSKRLNNAECTERHDTTVWRTEPAAQALESTKFLTLRGRSTMLLPLPQETEGTWLRAEGLQEIRGNA